MAASATADYQTFRLGAQAASSPYAGLSQTFGFAPEEIADKLAGPLQVHWTVSRRCNFACPHCFNNSGPAVVDPPVSRAALVDNIGEAKPFNVCLCGGEPLVLDDLEEIIHRLRDHGIPMVSLVTNGYLADEQRLRKLADSGLNNLQISLDGLSASDHGVFRPAEESWQRALGAIETSLRLNLFRWVAASFIPNRHTIRTFKPYVSMLARMGVTHIRVQPLMTTGRGAKAAQKLAPTAEDSLRLAIEIHELRSTFCGCAGGPAVNIELGDPLEHIWYYAFTRSLPQQLSIQTNGWYELSPYIPVLFGDATQHSIKEFWALSVKDMWRIPLMQRYARQVMTIPDMATVEPRIYFDSPVLIDRFDPDHWAIALQSDDPEELRAAGAARGCPMNAGVATV